MIIKCAKCDKEFKIKPSHVTGRNCCSRACVTRQITKPCGACGKSVTRCQSQMFEHVFCSRKCSKKWTSERFTAMNIELNPDRMIPATREKLRDNKLGTGKSVSYEKTYGRHTHRVVMAEKIGRPLLPGEVVHHIDENIRNNHPDNLMLFPNQAAHARWHKLKT